MNKRLKAVISLLLAVLMAFSAPAIAMAAVSTASKYTGKVYTHNSRYQNYDVYNAIDVSSHNGTINWKKVKNDGINHAIIRAGWTGYTKSKHSIQDDTYFKQNIQGAINAGISVGVYWYSQALNENEARAEANALLNNIKGYKIDMPVYCDYEFAGTSDGRVDSAWSTGALNKSKMTANVRAFCETIKNAGYTPGVYANASFLTTNIDGAALSSSYTIWLAHYTTKTYYTNNYNMWQYTDSGKVDGISTSVDCNFLYIPKADSTKVTGLVTAGRAEGGTKIRLSWDAQKNASGYKVYQKINGVFTQIGEADSNEFTVTNLTPGWEYYFRVSAVIDGAEGEPSDDLYTVAACAPIQDFSAQALNDSTIQLGWTKGVCHGYFIQWSTDPTFKTGVQYKNVVSSSLSSYTINVGDNAQDYYVRIRAWRNWDGGYVYGDFTKSTPVMAKVTGLITAGRSNGGTVIRLSWDAQKNADSYNVYQVKNGDYALIGSTKSTEFSVTGLNAGWEYYFRVSAVKEGKECEPSEDLYTVAACAPVSDFKVTSNDVNTIQLNWTKGVCHGYFIQWSTDPTFSKDVQYKNIVSSQLDSYTINVDGNAQDYYVRIRAWRNWDGGYVYGDFSDAVKVEMSDILKVTGLVSAGRGEGGTRIRLGWDAQENADKYNVYQKIDGEYKLIGTSETNDFNVTGLNAGWEYYFKVAAVKGDKVGELSDELYTVAACAPVADFTVKATDANTIQLNWTKGVCHGYFIQWSTDPTFSKDVQSSNIAFSQLDSYTINVDGNAQDYYVRIRAWRNWDGGYVYGDFSDGVKAAVVTE